MELSILDSSFGLVGIIDAFESLIWTDRYFECGDFDLITTPNATNVGKLIQGTYASIRESDHIMLIEDITIVTDPVKGNRLSVKGRSGEIITDRRVVWNQTDITDLNIDQAVYLVVNGNIIAPTGDNAAARIISNFTYDFSEDENVTDIIISSQYWGNSVYNAVVDMCYAAGVGFKVIINETGQFVMSVYAGVDRTYDQLENPYVIFSPDFENLRNSTYIASTRPLRTVCLTAGEKGIGNIQTSVEVDISDGEVIGVNRREMFLDAQNVTRTDDEGNPITEEEYLDHLRQKGLEELSINTDLKTFSSEVDPIRNFIFDRDFFMGDIIQVSNEFGFEGKSRVVEVTRTQDQTGFRVFPIFSAL